MSTFSLLNLPASELEKAKNLPAGENDPDVIVGGKNKPMPAHSSVAVVDPPKPIKVRDRIPLKPVINTRVQPSQVVEGPRYTNFMAHTYRLHENQIDILNRIEAEIVRNGVQKQERITNNSILRALVDLLSVLKLDMTGIASETELKRRIFEKCGQKVSEQTNRSLPNA